MAQTGDLKQFQIAAVLHAQQLKKLVNEAKALRDYWDKLDLLNDGAAADLPLVKADLTNYATLCDALKNFAENGIVSTADRKAVYERVATKPVS